MCRTSIENTCRKLIQFGLMLVLPLTVEGACLDLQKSPLKLELRSIDSSVVEVRLVNKGESDVSVFNVFVTGGGTLEFTITDGMNKTIPYFGPALKMFLGRNDVATLSNNYFVGAIMDLRNFGNFDYLHLPSGYRLIKGRYKVVVKYYIHSFFCEDFEGVENLLTGQLYSNPVFIDVE